MPSVPELTRAFLRSIDVDDGAIDDLLDRLDDLRAVEDLRYRVIAHAKAQQATGNATYTHLLRSIATELRRGPRLRTRADALFASAAARYPELRAKAEAEVVRWEWWTGIRYEPTPLYAERHRFPRGRRVEPPPDGTPTEGLHGFGFDAEGELRVERTLYETYFERTAEGLRTFHYSYHKAEPINARLFVYEDARPVELHFTAKGGSSIERYTYDAASHLVRIDVEHGGESGFQSQCLEIENDPKGRAIRVDQVISIARTTLWKKPTKRASLTALLRDIESHCLAMIPTILARAPIEGPAYCLALALNGEGYDQLLPPMLGIGLVSERDRFLAEHGDEATNFLWSPPEWEWFDKPELELWDDRMKELATTANQLLWEREKTHLAEKLSTSVAKALNAMELPIARSDDFVVFACDFTVGDGAEGVVKAAPPDLRKRLSAFL